MLDLPNDRWIRSAKMPEYAINLDPDSLFFGWKMVEGECYKKWVSVAQLKTNEIAEMKIMPEFSQLIDNLEKLE